MIERTNKNQDVNIKCIDFQNHANEIYDNGKVLKGSRKPRILQQEAINSVLNGFKIHDRGRLIMACGSGKTYVSLCIAEQHLPKNSTILFLAPSISLVSQARFEYMKWSKRDMKGLVVCSDSTAGKNEEDDINITDVECKVITDPLVIFNFIQNTAADLKVIFCTYQSLDKIMKMQKEHDIKPFDMAICDDCKCCHEI